MDQPLGLTLRETLAILLLILSLAGNWLQLYRHRLHTGAIHNGLVAAFNSIGWLLARCVSTTRDLAERIERTEKWAPQHGPLGEFRTFSVDTEFMLRQLHELLVGSARTLGVKDPRWQAGEFGYTPEELEKFRRSFAEWRP